MKPKHHNIMTPTRKTFQNSVGKWIEKRTKTEILVCSSCSEKYIKSRKNQETCIRCIYSAVTARMR